MKHLALLGSTGSIGTSTLDVVAAAPDRYRVVALAAGRNLTLLREQVCAFRPAVVAVQDEQAAAEFRAMLPSAGRPEILAGPEGYRCLAGETEAQMVVSAMVGAAGLEPTYAAVCAGKDVALANKETLVVAGDLITETARRTGSRLLPVDSEHSAIFQCLLGHEKSGVSRIVLTASGGPFRGWTSERLKAVTPGQALKHPTWTMGRKISIDSATLMNKGLEVIEAHWLFDMPYEAIDVVVHPQSIVHSLVEYRDGALLAHLGMPDMRIPIAYALNYPERVDMPHARLELTAAGSLTFEPPDREAFPCLDLAYRAGKAGGCLPAAMNAANEVAVAGFLAGAILFTGISRLLEAVLDRFENREASSLADYLEADRAARRLANDIILKENPCP